MIVNNISTGETLITNCSIANSFFKRLKGLIGNRGLTIGDGLVIYPCHSVHTYFMKYNIAVLFLDNSKKLLHIISDMPPKSVSEIVKGSKYVIEINPNVLALHKISIGDVFEFN